MEPVCCHFKKDYDLHLQGQSKFNYKHLILVKWSWNNKKMLHTAGADKGEINSASSFRSHRRSDVF